MYFLSRFDRVLVIFFVLAFMVIGAAAFSPSQPYHSLSQITANGSSGIADASNVILPLYGGTGVSSCADGEVLKWDSGQSKWVCNVDVGGSGGGGGVAQIIAGRAITVSPSSGVGNVTTGLGTVPGFLDINTSYGDAISIGGDSAGNDAEIKFNPTSMARNIINIWTPGVSSTALWPTVKSGSFVAGKDLNSPRICIGSDCRSAWPDSPFIVPSTTSDPVSPQTGQMWLRTDIS